MHLRLLCSRRTTNNCDDDNDDDDNNEMTLNSPNSPKPRHRWHHMLSPCAPLPHHKPCVSGFRFQFPGNMTFDITVFNVIQLAVIGLCKRQCCIYKIKLTLYDGKCGKHIVPHSKLWIRIYCSSAICIVFSKVLRLSACCTDDVTSLSSNQITAAAASSGNAASMRPCTFYLFIVSSRIACYFNRL